MGHRARVGRAAPECGPRPRSLQPFPSLVPSITRPRAVGSVLRRDRARNLISRFTPLSFSSFSARKSRRKGLAECPAHSRCSVKTVLPFPLYPNVVARILSILAIGPTARPWGFRGDGERQGDQGGRRGRGAGRAAHPSVGQASLAIALTPTDSGKCQASAPEPSRCSRGRRWLWGSQAPGRRREPPDLQAQRKCGVPRAQS